MLNILHITVACDSSQNAEIRRLFEHSVKQAGGLFQARRTDEGTFSLEVPSKSSGGAAHRGDRTAYIREHLAQKETPMQIVAKAAKAGLDIRPALVYTVRARGGKGFPVRTPKAGKKAARKAS